MSTIAGEGTYRAFLHLNSITLLTPTPPFPFGRTPLSDAVREGHVVIARSLIERGAKLGFDRAKTSGELCDLAQQGDLNRIKLLLQGGCDPNAADYDQRTCLHLAASEGNMHVLRELLNNNVEVNHLDRWGGSALADAVRHGHRQCAVELHRAGGKLMYDEVRASSELCEAARRGDLETIKLLLDCGINGDAADYDQRTMLHLAASMGHKHIVDYLAMRRCVTLTSKDRWGGTPLDDAIREKHNQLAEALHAYYKVLGLDVHGNPEKQENMGMVGWLTGNPQLMA